MQASNTQRKRSSTRTRVQEARVDDDEEFEPRFKKARTRKSKTKPKKPNLIKEVDDINDDVCCACFGTYEEDLLSGVGCEWLQCACTRWIHEDCVEDRTVDSEGKDRICPLCLAV